MWPLPGLAGRDVFGRATGETENRAMLRLFLTALRVASSVKQRSKLNVRRSWTQSVKGLKVDRNMSVVR